jgi:hypothetical protein
LYRGEEAGVGGAGGARSGGGDAVHGGGCDCGFVKLVGLMRLMSIGLLVVGFDGLIDGVGKVLNR